MKEKLDVCLLNDSFPPVIDGVSNTILNYADIIQANWGNVMVATPSVPDADDNYSYPVYRYPSLNTMKLCGYRAGYPFDAASINAMQKNNIDVIHSHCPVMSTLLARTLRKNTDAPIILTYHTKFDIDIAKAVKSNLIQSAAVKFLAANISACDEVWAVSHGAGENLRKIGYDGNYIVMENGVDFPKERVSSERINAISALHSLPDGVPVFMFVGRMMWYKGVKLSLDGLKRALEAGEDFRMIFIGDGADIGDIKDYSDKLGLHEKCIFVGAVHDRELLRDYFCRSDLFLFPSTYDTNGIVVREAAACSLASVLIEDSCAAEGITDGRNGIIIKENAEAMGNAIINACRDLEGMHKIGEHAANDIYVSWEESVSRAYDRYFTVIERKKSGIVTHEDPKSEDFFGMVSNICGGIEKVQEQRDRLITRSESAIEKVKTREQEHRIAIKAKEQEHKAAIKAKEQKIKDKFCEMRDRYL